ncbi:hypothetical protein [Halomonas litopenaei]
MTRQGNGKNGDNDQRIDVKERSANKARSDNNKHQEVNGDKPDDQRPTA